MEPISLQQSLETFVLDKGACLCSGCDLGYAPLPQLPSLHYAFSFAVKLSNAIVKTVDGAPSFAYFQHYRTANTLLDSIAFQLTAKLETLGYQAYPVAASQSLGKQHPYEGILPHKTAAVLSGIGFVGKSGLLLTERHGSKIRLCTVVTDLPLTPSHPVIENGCGDCQLCMRACPAGAIYGELPKTNGERNFDAEKCSKYMKEHFQDVGRGSVCGICMSVCPKNR